MCLGLLTPGWFVLQAAADFLPGILGLSGKGLQGNVPLASLLATGPLGAGHLVHSFSRCPPLWRVLLPLPQSPNVTDAGAEKEDNSLKEPTC